MSPWTRDDYTAVWICALPLELAAACAMLDERHDPLPLDPDSRDTNNYVLGRVGSHNTVVACLPYGVMGTVSTARVVNQMLATFKRIKFGLMIGIGGGAPSDRHDIRLGDVVVGSPTGLVGGVVQYDFGKTVQRGRFQRTGMLNKPPEVLLTALSNLQARHLMEGHRVESTLEEMVKKYPPMSFQYARPTTDNLYRADYEHPEGQPTCVSCDSTQSVPRAPRPAGVSQLRIHHGLIASGDQVVKHGLMRDQLREELDVLCFEMEAAGMVDSLPCLVIRGISDYADSHKNDVWQGYAAATAAGYAKELMHVIPVAVIQKHPVRVRVGSGKFLVNSVPSVLMRVGAGEMRFKVQQWLSPASFKDDLYNHQKEYMDGSCDWALERPEVMSFLSPSNNSEVLSIRGAPGIGKSTLAGFLIRRLVDAGRSVLYFFCKDTEGGKSKPYQALRTIISQILAADDGQNLVSWLEKIRLQSGQRHAESFATLHDLLCHALYTVPVSDRTLYFAVDALDECDNGRLLASTLSSALNASKRPFKLLLTSREEPDLLEFFQQYKERTSEAKLAVLNELSILPSTIQQSVVAYVKQRVAHFQHIRATPLGQQVFNNVAASSDGSWLYAKLILDEIERLPSPASIARHLKNIPTGLVQLYHTIFSTVEKSLSPAELYLAQQLFIWIDMKDFVLVGRNALDRDVLDIVFQAANSGDEVFDSIGLARKLCSPLITLKSNRKSDDTESSVTISFVHHTAMQFVRQSIVRNGPSSMSIPAILKPQPLKALHRASTAMWYFQKSEQCTSLLSELTASPYSQATLNPGGYFEMAYALWGAFYLKTLPEHLDDDDDDLQQASTLCTQLTEFLLSASCLRWVELAIIINYRWGYVNLFSNVKKALRAAEAALKPKVSRFDEQRGNTATFRRFSVVRREFFADFAHVISCTGPALDDERPVAVDMPDGFESRPVAMSLMRLGNKWGHLYER
jgi:nucleoside phosphorylase